MDIEFAKVRCVWVPRAKKTMKGFCGFLAAWRCPQVAEIPQGPLSNTLTKMYSTNIRKHNIFRATVFEHVRLT